jgi:hypothetical protein
VGKTRRVLFPDAAPALAPPTAVVLQPSIPALAGAVPAAGGRHR